MQKEMLHKVICLLKKTRLGQAIDALGLHPIGNKLARATLDQA
jgi:hypothetical protein